MMNIFVGKNNCLSVKVLQQRGIKEFPNCSGEASNRPTVMRRGPSKDLIVSNSFLLFFCDAS